MCASLDTIESTQVALDSYNCLDKDNIKDTGLEYVIVYGLFQSLYVQQDSVYNLCKSIDVPVPKKRDLAAKYPELYRIRQLRNKGIGHPSSHRTNNTHTILIYFNRGSFELFSYTEAGELSSSTYEISKCIKEQSQSLCGIIQQVIEKMKSIEQEHKEEYMQNKLTDCFPTDPQYCLRKIFEAINLIDAKHQEELDAQRIGRETRIRSAFSQAQTLIESINKFDLECSARGLHDVYVRIEIEHSKYPLEKLKESFSPTSKNLINSEDARAYADSAEKHILELLKQAKNLDNEYSSTS